MPEYDFDEFKRACGETNKVFALPEVLEDADRCFNLRTRRRLLDFIHNDGLQMCTHFNTKILEKNTYSDDTIMVDAYKFKSGGTLGYMAFFYLARTKNWMIKSFKFDRDSNAIMAEAFRRAGVCIPWESGENDGTKK